MIEVFEDSYRFLSNFHPSPIELGREYGYRTYATVENFYQACKTTDARKHDNIRLQPTPGKAKREGRKVEIRPDWEQIKDKVMLKGIREKFKLIDLRKKLLDTGDEHLQEGNFHGDKIWGCVMENGEWVGENRLGNILMQVREEIRISESKNT